MTTSEIRTFKPRRGRIGARRREALPRLILEYGVEVAGGALDPATVFGRRAPLVLEIGSGMGDHVAELAAADPSRDYLAAEVHTAGVANLLLLIESRGLTNLRVVPGDALALLRQRLPPDCLDATYALFPDPWPKTRHHKRRLFQPGHIALLRSRLAPGGTLHAATDWAEYAVAMRDALSADPELVNVYQGEYEGWAPQPAHRPRTRYESRARAAGRPVFALVFRRRPPRS
jgi:tRNA (guanine-N7-)-methyltransferase